MSRPRTLVTGGAGFIGAHLVAELCSSGHEVVVLDDFSSGTPSNLSALNLEVPILESDIARPESLTPFSGQRIDTIFHLAARASVPESVRLPVEDFETNLRGTLNVLELARELSAQVVFPSTVSVYDKDAPKPISEAAVVRASSPYGAAKLGGENYCYAYSNCYGVRTVVARLFNVYGPLMGKYVIHDFVRKLQKNPEQLTIEGSGDQIRDYTYVTDAVAALMLLADRSAPGGTYNVGSGVPTGLRDLARAIAKEMGLDEVELICTNESTVGDIEVWYADVTRLSGLGYQPVVPLEVGLRMTVQYIVNHP